MDGVNDIESEGNWVYASTGTSITYSNWRSDHPSGGTSYPNDCAYIHVTTSVGHGLWVSDLCGNPRWFICEI